ncbi:MAG: hypothetical protein IJD51_02495 [Clostridia bacterium]|nr:hypothetical protein [Clostridia bacterium]
MKKWYEGIYRRQLTDMHINDTDPAFLSRLSADEYLDCLQRASIQSPMIYLHSHVGLCNYPTQTARTHPRFAEGENEIKRLISKCRGAGMRVVGYYSLIFNNCATEAHPEWEMRHADGTTWRDDGQRYGLCCPNNEDYRHFLKKQIDELAEQHFDIDAIFYDMPYWEVVCYCPSCQKRYREQFGRPLPETQDFTDPEWLRFVKARQDWMVDFVKFVKKYTGRVMPDLTVEFNYAAVIGCDWLGGSTEGINAECEFTGGDLYGDLYSHSFACKYYYGATNNQPFEYMTCRCDSTLREHTITKPEDTLTREILLTAAHHGASLIIDAIDPVGTLDARVYDRVGRAFARQIPYEPYMSRGTLYSEVAVYFDSRTMYSPRGDDRYNRTSAIGAVRKLIEGHIPVSVISNGNMEGLSRYQMIIAPSLQDFDNDEPLRLIDYVREGGTLYLSGASDSRLIRELLGGTVTGLTYGDTARKRVQLGARTYISPREGYELGEFNSEYPLPLTYFLPIMEGARGDVLATVTLPYAEPDNNLEFASIHSCPPWRATEHPAIIERSYGKGRVIWCAAELEYDPRRAFGDIFRSLVERNITKKYALAAGRSIECVIFEDEGATYLSLADLRYDEAKHTGDIPLTVRTEVSPTAVTCLGTGRAVPFTYDRATRTATLTLSVTDFEMFEIKY